MQQCYRMGLLSIALLSCVAAKAATLTASVAYMAGVRHLSESGQTDYYDGMGYGGRLSFGGKTRPEFFLSYHLSNQLANYEDLAVGPTESKDQFIGLGLRKFLATGQRCFLEAQLLTVLSDNFDSPKFGGGLGGGLSWAFGKSMRISTTTLYSYIAYSGFHRRYLSQSLELSLGF